MTIGNRVLTVAQAAAPGLRPFGSFDAPLNGQVVSGSVALGGWALDDLRIARVALYRSAVAGEPNVPIFVFAFDVRQCDGTLKRVDVDVTMERQDE